MKNINELYKEAMIRNEIAKNRDLEINELKKKLALSQLEITKQNTINKLTLEAETLIDEIIDENEEEEMQKNDKILGMNLSQFLMKMHTSYTEEEINEWYNQKLQDVKFKHQKDLAFITKLYANEETIIILIYEKSKEEIIDDYLRGKVSYHLENDDNTEDSSSYESSLADPSEDDDEEEYDSSGEDSNIDNNSSIEQIGDLKVDQD